MVPKGPEGSQRHLEPGMVRSKLCSRASLFFSLRMGTQNRHIVPFLKSVKATNEQQDDGAGIMHQGAQFPIDQVYFIYTRRPRPSPSSGKGRGR